MFIRSGYNLASVSGALDNQKFPSPDALSMNSWTIFRDNQILSNGGILVEGDSKDILVEGNIILYPGGYRPGDDIGICISNSTRNVFLRGNDAPVETGGACA